jgi:hypothetical protein
MTRSPAPFRASSTTTRSVLHGWRRSVPSGRAPQPSAACASALTVCGREATPRTLPSAGSPASTSWIKPFWSALPAELRARMERAAEDLELVEPGAREQAGLLVGQVADLLAETPSALR